MRFTKKVAQLGDRRDIRCFALWPRWLYYDDGKTKVTVWLEYFLKHQKVVNWGEFGEYTRWRTVDRDKW